MSSQSPSGNPPLASDSLSQDRRRPDKPLSREGTLLANLFAAMSAVGDDAEAEYQSALKQLRAEPELAIIEIARSENDCGRQDYPGRWACVHAAAELRHAATLPFLRSLVLRPIPPEESEDPHSFSTVAEETILRTTAVDGVAELAKDRRDALEALFEFLSVDSLSVRRAAVQGLLATPRGRRLRARIEASLPADQRFLLDLKRIDVRDAPQVKRPQRYLSEKGRQARIEPAPGLPGDEQGGTGAEERGASPRSRDG